MLYLEHFIYFCTLYASRILNFSLLRDERDDPCIFSKPNTEKCVVVTPKILVSPKHAVNHILSSFVYPMALISSKSISPDLGDVVFQPLVFVTVPSRRVCGYRSNTRSMWETQCRLSKPSSGFGICFGPATKTYQVRIATERETFSPL